MFNNPVISEGKAKAIYDVLVKECGANKSDEDSFVYEFTTHSKYGPASEWRFQGLLGYGGKFRYPRLSVDCYRDDETSDRLAIIERTNEKLALLK